LNFKNELVLFSQTEKKIKCRWNELKCLSGIVSIEIKSTWKLIGTETGVLDPRPKLLRFRMPGLATCP
jgi:hypothetical protein